MREPLRPLPDPEREARLRAQGFGPELLPLTLTEAERIAAMPDLPVPPLSPTGTPVIPVTGPLLKVAILVVAIAGVMITADFFPDSRLDEKIAGVVLTIGNILGITSAGLRKPS